jgi:ubiquinone/menaquinone biosynthesis C-methylase UbiE
MKEQFQQLKLNLEPFGYFKPTDPVLNGLRRGNWGSREFEYMWASKIVSVKDKDVLDLGTGMPSDHNWHQFVREYLEPTSYVGIDINERMKQEEINEPSHKMLWMDMTDLKFPDQTFDVVYSLSTYEHIPVAEQFFKAMEETHRVMKPGGILVVTLDEIWNTLLKPEQCICSTWNDLERDLVKKNCVDTIKGVSFGIEDFTDLVKQWFKPVTEPPVKQNAQQGLLYSREYNSVVSHGVYQKI